MTTYTLDSNILIDMHRLYPRYIFSSLWNEVESLISNGSLCICEVVLSELKKGNDTLYNWANTTKDFVHQSVDSEMRLAAQISQKHPGWVREETNYGDPFVIAHAAIENHTIVTNEKYKGPGTIDCNMKIPNVADEFDVPWMNFFDFVKKNGWVF